MPVIRTEIPVADGYGPAARLSGPVRDLEPSQVLLDRDLALDDALLFGSRRGTMPGHSRERHQRPAVRHAEESRVDLRALDAEHQVVALTFEAGDLEFHFAVDQSRTPVLQEFRRPGAKTLPC